MPSPLRMDPSRTTTLQNRFAQDIMARVRRLKGRINELVITNDEFGLSESRLGGTPILRMNAQAWRFRPNDEKMGEFQAWFSEQVDDGILSVDGAGDPWTNAYVDSAYKKGAIRAYTDSHKELLADDAGFYAGTKEEFLRAAFDNPEAVGKIRSIYTRSYAQLKTTTAKMDAGISRVLSLGLAEGKNPRQLARELNQVVDGLSRPNALRIARTEIMHAHSEGQLDSFEAMGVEELGIFAEYSTAGDDLVCPLCLPLESVIFTIKEARGVLPRHPSCRCVWTPANVREKKARIIQTPDGPKTIRQTTTKEGIDRKILRSAQAEHPNSKNPLDDSRWAGAKKTYVKKKFGLPQDPPTGTIGTPPVTTPPTGGTRAPRPPIQRKAPKPKLADDVARRADDQAAKVEAERLAAAEKAEARIAAEKKKTDKLKEQLREAKEKKLAAEAKAKKAKEAKATAEKKRKALEDQLQEAKEKRILAEKKRKEADARLVKTKRDAEKAKADAAAKAKKEKDDLIVRIRDAESRGVPTVPVEADGKLIAGYTDSYKLPASQKAERTATKRVITKETKRLQKKFPNSTTNSGKFEVRFEADDRFEYGTQTGGKRTARAAYNGGVRIPESLTGRTAQELELGFGRGVTISPEIQIAVRLEKGASKIQFGEWTTTGKNTLGVYRHEFGHHIHAHLTTIERLDWEGVAAKFIAPKAESVVSQYAKLNADEFFAECFATYADPSYKAGTLPKTVVTFFERAVK